MTEEKINELINELVIEEEEEISRISEKKDKIIDDDIVFFKKHTICGRTNYLCLCLDAEDTRSILNNNEEIENLEDKKNILADNLAILEEKSIFLKNESKLFEEMYYSKFKELKNLICKIENLKKNVEI